MKTTHRIVPGWVLLVAGVSCFVALADLPYGFYKLLRWMVCITAVTTTIEATKRQHASWPWIHGLVAVIFNPIFPLFFDRAIWSIIDVLAGLAFVIYWIRRRSLPE